MNITLMAHDKKKELMVQFCTAYKSILSKHSISATATTGRLVAEATGLPVSLFLSKNQGGHQQIDARRSTCRKTRQATPGLSAPAYILGIFRSEIPVP